MIARLGLRDSVFLAGYCGVSNGRRRETQCRRDRKVAFRTATFCLYLFCCWKGTNTDIHRYKWRDMLHTRFLDSNAWRANCPAFDDILPGRSWLSLHQRTLGSNMTGSTPGSGCPSGSTPRMKRPTYEAINRPMIWGPLRKPDSNSRDARHALHIRRSGSPHGLIGPATRGPT